MILLYKQIKQGEIGMVARSLAFSTVLALVPFVAVVIAVFKMVGGLETMLPMVQGLFFRYFRQALGNDVTNMLKFTILKLNASALGTTAAAFLVFTSFRLLQDMEYGINRMWKANPTRPTFNRLGIAGSMMLLIPVLLAIYAGLRSVDMFKPIFRSYRDWVDGIVAISGLFIIYKILPETRVNTKKALMGALVSGLGLFILEKSFLWVTKTFFMVSKIYGSVATIPLFLIYILIVWYIILTGAAFVAYLHKDEVYEEPILK